MSRKWWELDKPWPDSRLWRLSQTQPQQPLGGRWFWVDLETTNRIVSHAAVREKALQTLWSLLTLHVEEDPLAHGRRDSVFGNAKVSTEVVWLDAWNDQGWAVKLWVCNKRDDWPWVKTCFCVITLCSTVWWNPSGPRSSWTHHRVILTLSNQVEIWCVASYA